MPGVFLVMCVPKSVGMNSTDMLRFLHDEELPPGIGMGQTLQRVTSLKARLPAFTIGFWAPADNRGVEYLRMRQAELRNGRRAPGSVAFGCSCLVS